MVFFSVIYLHFAKQSVKKDEPKTYFLIVNYFILTKNLYLCTQISVSWKETNGEYLHFVLFGLRIFLDKDPEVDRQKDNKTSS